MQFVPLFFFVQYSKFYTFVTLNDETMATKIKKEGLNAPAKEKNYVVIGGKRVSRTWAAMLANKKNPLFEIVDMRAVLK